MKKLIGLEGLINILIKEILQHGQINWPKLLINRPLKNLLSIYIVFALLYGSIHIIYGFGPNLNDFNAPIWMVLSRDVVFFLTICTLALFSRSITPPKDLFILIVIFFGLVLISTMHMHADLIGHLHHNIRNLLMY